MTFRRRILRYGPSPEEWQGAIEERAIAGCQFELHRCGGCGRGEVRLHDRFDDRQALAIGEWIACEYDDGDRWYLGRIEERRADSPGGLRLQLEGMSVQLNEVYPGGFGGADADGKPHRYGNTDRFPDDPDRHLETQDAAERPEDVVRLLMAQYVVPATDIRVEAGLIEDAASPAEPVNLKFNGEETVRTVLKDLALRARNAAWGVDELGQFYLLQSRSDTLMSFREGENLIELREEQSRDSIYNRVLLTGGYVYTAPTSDNPTRTAARWRGNYRQPASIEKYGERRLRMWVPWIRTAQDSRNFVREFFRLYAEPSPVYEIEAVAQEFCPRPWLGRVQILDRHDNVLLTAQPETVRVRFDNTPRLSFVLGPEDPRTHWPEPPHDERYPVQPPAIDGDSGPGGPITLTLPSDGDDPPDPDSSSDSMSGPTSETVTSELLTSDDESSELASSESVSSGATSESSAADSSGELSDSLSSGETSDSSELKSDTASSFEDSSSELFESSSEADSESVPTSSDELSSEEMTSESADSNDSESPEDSEEESQASSGDESESVSHGNETSGGESWGTSGWGSFGSHWSSESDSSSWVTH